MSAGEILLKIENAVLRNAGRRFRYPVDWTIRKGEQWAVTGPNASGKSLLAGMVSGGQALKTGRIAYYGGRALYEDASLVSFASVYELIDTANSYYQQRWNRGDVQTSPFLGEVLPQSARVGELVSFFGLGDALGKRLNMLSSGELRKFLLVRGLSRDPRILVLDDPYIGLDAPSRHSLDELLAGLVERENITVILITPRPDEIPAFITHVQPVAGMELLPPLTREDFSRGRAAELFTGGAPQVEIPRGEVPDTSFRDLLLFRGVRVGYDGHAILDGIDWRVRRGEKWALLGNNGSGKSTLLGLVFGDNPQAYANDIVLFDRRRGTGESIWDIKRRIGFVSPEMAAYYRKNVNCEDVAVSGFHDVIGAAFAATGEQYDKARRWMEVFGVGHLYGQPFLKISSGQRQLLLLARAFVKEAGVMVLDEPMHGLDPCNRERVKRIIGEWCGEGRTLIIVTHYADEIPASVDNCLSLSE